ncbi:MAG TPA: phenylalanine--tRNA ligase subunit beta [Candidatus Saccharimonadales bacterium]|nr:phenylalanine--tRNA ligase subunit beta [Candidatus Saccharimonadales bacterium]
MKVSLNAMKFFSDNEPMWRMSVDQLVVKIGSQLGAVEEVIDLRNKYKGIKIVEILEAAPHPNAEKLNVYQAFDGREHVQVVSGDTSLNIGDKVAWLEPGMTVPSSLSGDEPFVLEVRSLRGQMSHGMFASGRELDINDDHEGVLKLDTQEPAGTFFADAYNLDDVIINIENKMFTHRPDCFGSLGIVREIAGIQGLPFTSPDWYVPAPELPQAEHPKLKLTVENTIADLVPRYMAVALEVTVGPSPLWLQSSLRRLGIRSINNVVDITNYVMVTTGQPLHAFDYDAVSGGTDHATIVVRKPKKGESLTLLDGKTITPHADTMLICDQHNPIALGGMMGGRSTEVTPKTKRIILECATFDMYTIRRSSMRHGVFTDAVTRFSKGQSSAQNAAVLTFAVNQLVAFAGGKLASKIVDDYPKKRRNKTIALTAEFINDRLGSAITPDLIATTLRNVECTIEEHGGELLVTPPFWRTDIEIAEDVVEEVGRLVGFDKLEHTLPQRTTTAAWVSRTEQLKSRIRSLLAAAGANELQTYSFVPETLLEAAGQQKVHAFRVRNALSPELQHYRLSLTPNLLEKIHSNSKAGFDQFALFEINKVHIKGDEDCDGLPREYQTLAFTYANKKEQPGAPFYAAKAYLDFLLGSLGIEYQVTPADQPPQWEIGRQVFAPFEPKRSAFVLINGEFAGFIGEYTAKTRRSLKLPAYTAGFEVDLDRLKKYVQAAARYERLLKFPATDQDVSLRVPFACAFATVRQSVVDALQADARLRTRVEPRAIYQAHNDDAHKTITFRITLQHQERTLTTDEVNNLIDQVVAAASAQTGAERA